MSIRLLVIDPQNDFCDIPSGLYDSHPSNAPALAVPGAHNDMLRLADFIRTNRDVIDELGVTLDSHQAVGIERTTFWVKRDGTPVEPFTTITTEDVRSGEYLPRDLGYLSHVLDYLEQLQQRGRYKLTVWPVHCVIGSWGHQIHYGFGEALGEWLQARQKGAYFVVKGLNMLTEHYSAVRAEVPLASDLDSTFTNNKLVSWAGKADVLLVAGEAGSHCVKSTVDDLLYEAHIPDKRREVILLEDCISPVAGFEAHYTNWLAEMSARGVKRMTVQEATGYLQTVVEKA